MFDKFESYQASQENVCTTSGIPVIPTLLLCIDDADAGGPFVGQLGVRCCPNVVIYVVVSIHDTLCHTV